MPLSGMLSRLGHGGPILLIRGDRSAGKVCWPIYGGAMTLRFHGEFNLPQVNLRKYETVLRAKMLEVVTDAAVEWLKAVTETIPVWSGASLATFLRLAKSASFQLSVSPVGGNVPNRVALGQSRSEGEIVAEANRVFFHYATTLEHLIYNEFNNANVSPDPGLMSRLKNPGPYGFQELGAAAAKRVLDAFEAPNPIQVKTITF